MYRFLLVIFLFTFEVYGENPPLAHWIELAESGNLEAQCTVAHIYELGIGGEKNVQEAFRWYSIAAKKNYPGAQYRIGNFYADGIGVPQSHEEALKRYTLAATQGHGNSMVQLGVMSAKGIAVQQSIEEAAKWFEKACVNGRDVFLSFGLGFSALDKETSFKVLLQAAKNGNSSAQYALYYLVRNGVYKDYLDIKVSSKWLLVSAENGNQAAQEEVGLAYEIGDGFPKSKVRAHAWFNVAAIRNKEYIACRDRLEKGMSPKEISDAEQLAQEIFMSK